MSRLAFPIEILICRYISKLVAILYTFSVQSWLLFCTDPKYIHKRLTPDVFTKQECGFLCNYYFHFKLLKNMKFHNGAAAEELNQYFEKYE